MVQFIVVSPVELLAHSRKSTGRRAYEVQYSPIQRPVGHLGYAPLYRRA